MVSNRLLHLQNELVGFEEQISSIETSIRLAPLDEHARLEQKMQVLQAKADNVERKYWHRWKDESAGLILSEESAGLVSAEIVQRIETFEDGLSIQACSEIIALLQSIKNELTRQGKASNLGKLKATIPLLPGLLAYEQDVSIETPRLLKQLLPTFSSLSINRGK